jgi:hypothetical protein
MADEHYATVAGARIALPDAFEYARAIRHPFVYEYLPSGEVIEWHWNADREEWRRG